LPFERGMLPTGLRGVKAAEERREARPFWKS
jgi:hypothetical protein